MPLLTYGINHHSAPIEVRECIAFDPTRTRQALNDLIQLPAVNEVVLLSTCNRTELYTVTNNAEIVKFWLMNQHALKHQDIATYYYHYEEIDAVRHALRVASGLDSMVLGEPQILGQMKQAFHLACEIGAAGKQLKHLFPAIFSASKQIRYKTEISKNPISMAYATVLLAKRIFTRLDKHQVLLIGAGEMIELIATYLQDCGVHQMIFANRTIEKASHLSEQFNGTPIRIGDIPTHLPSTDIVITATASQLPIIGKGMIESLLKQKKRRPIFMVDLAVPRDIEPEVGELEDVYLYNIDHLQTIIQKNLKNREEAAKQAEAMAEIQANHYIRQLRILDASDMIRAYREQLETLRDKELIKAKTELKKGQDPQSILEFMAHNLINKIMHQPTIKLRQAAYNEQIELLLLAKEFFNL